MKRHYTRWNLPAVVEESKKYLTRSAFNKGNHRAYLAALRMGLMDHLFPIVSALDLDNDEQARLLREYPVKRSVRHIKRLREKVEQVEKKSAPMVQKNYGELSEAVRAEIDRYIRWNVKDRIGLQHDINDKMWLDDYGQLAEDYFTESATKWIMEND